MPWIIYVQDKGDNKREAMINMSYFTSKEDLSLPHHQVERSSAPTAQKTSYTVTSSDRFSSRETKDGGDR